MVQISCLSLPSLIDRKNYLEKRKMRMEKSLKMLQMECKHDVILILHDPGTFIMQDTFDQRPESYSLESLHTSRFLKCLKRRFGSKIMTNFVNPLQFK